MFYFGVKGVKVAKPKVVKVAKPKIVKPKVVKGAKEYGRREINAPNALLYPYKLDGSTDINPDMEPLLRRYINKYSDSYFGNVPLSTDQSNPGLVWYFFDDINGVPWHPDSGIQPTINHQIVNINSNPRSEPTFNIVGDVRNPRDNPYQYVCVVPNKELRSSIEDTNTYGTIHANVVAVHTHIREMVRYTQASVNHVRCYYILRKVGDNFVQLYGIFKKYQQTPPGSPSRSPGRQQSLPGSPGSSQDSYNTQMRKVLETDLSFGKSVKSVKRMYSLRSLQKDLKKILKS